MKSEVRNLPSRLPIDHEPLEAAQRLGKKGFLKISCRSRRKETLISFSAFVLSTISFATLGATNMVEGDELPPLRPPRAEIPLTFWEQHRFWIIGAGLFLLGIISVGIWFLTRPKPPTIVPPAAKAREALNTLQNQPETGEVLSKISQVIRWYFTAAFNLPERELTTGEFSRILLEQEAVGRSLADGVVEFLRQCDYRKFAQPAPRPPLEALSGAAKLIDEAEARRAALSPKTAPQ